ncbi:hypothetical protein M9434_001984 [Picochlorum sp. BPE23]|nr:hypothetical protein M9434_001984 [Picochlorum sp. BPE23]
MGINKRLYVTEYRYRVRVDAAGTSPRGDVEVAKKVTRGIVAAESFEEICKVLHEHETVLGLRHFTTALYFMAKKDSVNSPSPLVERELRWMSKCIIEDHHEALWSSTSVANVLQACRKIKNISLDPLMSVAMRKLVHGEKEVAQREVMTILSCLVRVPESDAKKRACRELEEAILGTSSVIVLQRGLEGFRRQDMGPLAWFLTELKCQPRTARSVFLHCRDVIGLENLSTPSLCLVCRMLSLQIDSTCEEIDEDVDAIVQCLICERRGVARMDSLKDSSMMLLSLARLIKARCEDDILTEKSFIAGMKWTHAVSAYRTANPSINRAIHGLLEHICPHLLGGSTMAGQGVLSSILYSLSLLQYQASEIIAACTRGIEAQKETLTLRTISTCSWSLSVLRYEDKSLLEDVFVDRILDGNLLMNVRDAEKEFAQSLSMILYSFAVLNMFQSLKSKNLLKAIMQVAEQSIPYLNTESLPIFGWSIVVAYSNMDMGDGAFGSVMKKWRSSVTENFNRIPKGTMAMIQHTEIALKIEAPELGLEDDIPYKSLFSSLYRHGRLRRSTAREWNSQQPQKLDAIALDGISLFQKQVYEAAEAVIPGWILEYWDSDLQYPVDMALLSHRIVIEADGPTHFTLNTQKPLGATSLKKRLLRRIGWHLITIPYFEWSIKGSGSEHIDHLSRLLTPYLQSTDQEKPLLYQRAQGETAREADDQKIGVREADDQHTGAQPSRDDEQPVKKNAATMDIIKASRGKMSLNDAVRRQIFRKQ